MRHFNPLPPHGGRPVRRQFALLLSDISIHSLRMEGDFHGSTNSNFTGNFNPLPPHGGRRIISRKVYFPAVHFNPLPPHGGRLLDQGHAVGIVFISIHSLRMEGDTAVNAMRTMGQNFNPLPPHGGRPHYYDNKGMIVVFQSTPSAWRETILIDVDDFEQSDFNPLPPHGGRLLTPYAPQNHCYISIHSLRMEGDWQ